MRKLLFGAVVIAIVALQPTPTTACPRSPVQGSTPTVTIFPEVQIPQATAVTADVHCFVGTRNGAVPGTDTPVQFVGNVLCLDPGPSGDFATFAQNCPSGSSPVIQSVQLTKIEPQIPKCPDTFPGGTFVQTPASTGIRTWWTLKHTPCDTIFRLEVTFACVTGLGTQQRSQIVEVRTNVFTFRVIISPRNLSWIIQALHNEPLGLCEVPCITDEGLFNTLLSLARTIRLAADAGPSQIVQLNQALDQFEATVVANCSLLISAARVDTDQRGNITRILPCGNAFPNGPPGNFTIGSRGFGIIDTLENPCCCKLIADIFCLKRDLIGNHL
jgi:hypothetical protein